MTLSPLESLGFIQPTDRLIKREIIDESSESLHDLFGLMAPIPDANHRQIISIGYPVMATHNPRTGYYAQWIKETWDFDQSPAHEFGAPVDSKLRAVALIRGNQEWRQEWYRGQFNDWIGYAFDTLLSQIDQSQEYENMLFCLQDN